MPYEREKHFAVLRMLLYHLHYVDSMEQAQLFSSDFKMHFLSRYSIQKIKEMILALEWSQGKPNYPFKKLVPGVNFSDKEIYYFLGKLLEKFKAEFSEQDFQSLSYQEDTRPLKVLIVEDSPMQYGFIESHFSDTPYQLEFASDKHIAWDNFSKDSFDVVIISLHRSPHDALELVKKIRTFEKNNSRFKTFIVCLNSEEETQSIETILDKIDEQFMLPIIQSHLLKIIKERV